MIQKEKTHCSSCGEWLDGYDMCPECGMIQKWVVFHTVHKNG